MKELIDAVNSTPINTILVVAGIIFLLLAVAGRISDKVEVPPKRQLWAALFGFLLLMPGLYLTVAKFPPPPPPVPTEEISPPPVHTLSIADSTLPTASIYAPTPTACPIAVDSSLTKMVEAEDLGCPERDAVEGKRSEELFSKQKFEEGWMFWRRDSNTIYVIYYDGTWKSFLNLHRDGEQVDIGCPAPNDRFRPDRGFGKVWRDNLGGCPEANIGWGMEMETNITAVVQDFIKNGTKNGTMIMLDNDPRQSYLLKGASSGTWSYGSVD